MSLTVASSFARRGRHSKAIHPTTLGSVASSAVPRHSQQQARSYRFGRLASYLEPYIRPDVYTRHYSHSYKYFENIHRRRSWDKHALAEDAKSTLKRAVCNYWSHRRAGHATGRYLNTDASPRKTPDNPEGVRPGQNIEDVERAPLEHLIFGDKKSPRIKKKFRSAHDRAASASAKNADVDYIIDPISNRKVPRRTFGSRYSSLDQGVEIPVRTSKPYKSQFEPFKAPELEDLQAPFFPDGPPPEAELKLYNQNKLWDSVTQSEGATSTASKTPARSSLLDTLNWEHEEVQWARNDPAAWARETADAPEYTDLHRYTAVRYQEPDGKPADEQSAPTYEDLDRYRAVEAHEPDGKYKANAESLGTPPELNKYGAVRAHEPDGKYKLDSQSPETPPELSKYGVVRAHEPDGKYKLDSELPETPPELNKYGAFRAHEPDGKYKLADEQSAPKYEDLDQYGAVTAHEPDGKYAAEYTEAPDAAELAAYSKPYLAHEPDGKYAVNHVKPERDADELANYRTPFFAHEPDGMYAAAYVEPPRDEAELAQYKAFRSHEPDGKYAASYVEEKPEAAELSTYGAFRSHEPDGKYAASHVAQNYDTDELATYGAFRSHEPDGKYAANDATSSDSAEISKYQAFRSHEPDGKYAAADANEKPAADELATYGAFRSHEPNGKYAADSAAASEAQDLANHEAFTYEDTETRPSPQETQPSRDAPDLEGYRKPKLDQQPASTVSGLAYEDYDPAELRKYQAVRWNEPDKKPAEAETAGQTVLEYDLNGETPTQEKSAYRNKVEELMAQAATESDAPAKSSQLTGNYVRDFPEEFSKSWKTQAPESTSSLLSSEQKESDSVIQPALERCSGSNPPSGAAGNASSSSSPKPTNPAEPALYKILVYDPTMQCIETAETTSIVPDSAAPLTPAEVLLRISNPAKFFPHFAPLQAQGFEIVSGGGDVLIFRKVRDAAVAESQASQETATAAGTAAPVNPIDMTGERRSNYTVAAGRFASPTGFVNYDLPPAAAQDAAAAARAEAKAEEWGGARAEAASGEEETKGAVGRKPKASLPKKVVVGTAWLAGVSYSLGVVSEYFKSGGVDGKGPRGL